jgi:cytochrome c556
MAMKGMKHECVKGRDGTRRRGVGIGLLVLAATAAARLGGATGTGGDKLTAEVMREKLALAQQALKGLALQDHALLRSSSDRLVKLSHASGWAARQTPEYELFTTEFRRAAAELSRAASEKNIDGATLAYTQMTVSCVSCHKYMRGGRGPATGTPVSGER